MFEATESEMTETPSLLIYASYRLQPDDVEAFQSVASSMAAAATVRDGCAFLDVTQDIGDPTTFRMVEGWRDQAALDAHLSSEAFQATLKEAGTLGIIDRSADVYRIGDKKPLAMP
jgi:quinol monooxygenase YgiN